MHDVPDRATRFGRTIRKRLIPLIVLALPLALFSGTVGAQSLSPSAQAPAKAALEAGAKNQWADAVRHAANTGIPVFEKYIDWMRLGDEKSGARFEEIAAFLTANPTWPGLKRLGRRAEEAVGPSLPDDLVLAWFGKMPPKTPDGAFQYARVLEAAGQTDAAERVVRDAWINMDMGSEQGNDFRRRFHKYIRQDDDIALLDRLLWDREVDAARRQLRFLPKKYRAMTESRIAFMIRSHKAPGTLRSVPQEFLDDPGMVFEQTRYYRRIRQPEKSVELLLAHPRLPKGPRPDRWWRERQYLVRWALSEEDPATAYKLVSTHVQTWGSEFAEAEFLAGWIALRKLNRPKDALRHFQALYDNVNYPVSRSRGAYWLARTYEALEQHNTATRWYRKAAAHPTRFYGQLAAGHLLEAERPALPPDPAPDEAQVAAFEARELQRLVRVLAALDRQRDVRGFTIAIAETASTPTDWFLTARLAQDIGRYDLAVTVSKLALREGVILSEIGYPALEPTNHSGEKFPEPQILHAVVRQESAFDQQAVSHAGARGLMQLMPQTALRVSRALKMRYSQARLTRDPTYNLRLGQAYLAHMLDLYDGSLILAFAAYNAGPVRVERWLQRYGDPGPFIYDAIDWAESIPFTETRNYVQRVIENLMVYLSRGDRKGLALTYKTLEPGPVKDSAGRLEGAVPLPVPFELEEDIEDDFAGP